MNKALMPCNIGGMEIRNRIVRSATADPMGAGAYVSDDEVKMYEELAKNHVGLIITGMAGVSEDAVSAPTMWGIYNDSFIEGHKRLAEAAHQYGSKIICQINHCGAASGVEKKLSPSGVPSPYTNNAPAVEMTVDDIKRVTKDFADGAARVKAAGYDGVQIHCAHGYLLSQFLNPLFNKRTDEYGVDGKGRFKFAKEVIEAVKAAVGDFPISVKINCNTEEGDEGYFPGDFLMMGEEFKKMGVQFVEVSGCDFTPRGRKGMRNYYLDRALALKKAADIPVVLVGGVRSLEDMDNVIDAGIDMVSMCRPFLCEPDLVTKFENGAAETKCVSCSKCFVLAFKYKPGGALCIQHLPKE